MANTLLICILFTFLSLGCSEKPKSQSEETQTDAADETQSEEVPHQHDHTPKLKIAMLDMKKLFDTYVNDDHPAKVKIRDTAKEIKDKNDLRIKEIRKIESEIKKLSDPNLSPEQLRKNHRAIAKLRRSCSSCSQMSNRREWLARRNKAINESIVLEMRKTLSDIQETIQKYAAEHDYDLILDSSARSSTQTEILTFAGTNVEDITEKVLKRLPKKGKF